MNGLAAAVAVALSMGFASQASAAIELKHNAKGDALIFPAFNGYVENYFTISNGSNEWIQGHLRFRGAAWSGELRDFDVILSPGDVFVFRVADLDGDGQWEIDQSLDNKNFKYTAQNYNCGSVSQCLDPSNRLIPEPTGSVLTEGVIEHQKHVGYVEYFGEAVLEGMTQEIMADLLTTSPSVANAPFQSSFFSRIGTNTWKWSDAANGFRSCTAVNVGTACDRGLSDVPNVLSGTAFITLPGKSQGLAYNAEALVNFRTANNPHRIDNYRALGYASIDTDATQIANNSAVILHHESGNQGTGPSPFGDYVYHFPTDGVLGQGEDRSDEARISFNNTWGPTLADGDDYSLVGLRDTDITGSLDDWDSPIIPSHSLDDNANSVAEVEEAIRADGQSFTSFYFDGAKLNSGDSALSSWFFAHYPTKFFYGESGTFYGNTTIEGYTQSAATVLLTLAKPVNVEIWDINEVPGGQNTSGCISPDPCAVISSTVLGQELNFFGVEFFKNAFNNGTADSFTTGRTVIAPVAQANNPRNSTGGNRDLSWPGLMYTFEQGGTEGLGQWRSMQR